MNDKTFITIIILNCLMVVAGMILWVHIILK